MARRQDELWRAYLDRLAAAGVDRDAPMRYSLALRTATVTDTIRLTRCTDAAQHFRIRERTNAMSKTHFGFQTVDEQEKAKKVAGVFHSVAANYDLMNDLMSAGLHRAWKTFTIAQAERAARVQGARHRGRHGRPVQSVCKTGRSDAAKSG